MRLVYGGYGHNPTGKQYVYWAGDNYRTGQNVLAPVTNKDGKTYNTMFTIMRTSGEDSPMAERESKRLEGLGINIKTIGGREIMSLPGAKDYSSATQWRIASQKGYAQDRSTRATYGEERAERIGAYTYTSPTQRSMARNQLTSYLG